MEPYQVGNDSKASSDSRPRARLSEDQYAALCKLLAQGTPGKERVTKSVFVSQFPVPLQNHVTPLFLQMGAIGADPSPNELSVPWIAFADYVSLLVREGMSWQSVFRDFSDTDALDIGRLDRSTAEWAMELSFWCTHPGLTPATAIEVMLEPGSVGMGADWASGCVTEVPEGSQASRKGVKIDWTMTLVDGLPYVEELLDKKIAGSIPYVVTFQTADPFASALKALKNSEVGDAEADWFESTLPCAPQSIGTQVGQCLLGSPSTRVFTEIGSRILDASLAFLLRSMNARLWWSDTWDPLYRDWSDGRSFHSMLKNVQHYKGFGVLLIRGTGGEIIGAVSDCWEDGMGQFGGSSACFLFSLHPSIQVCHAKESCKNFAYLNSRNKNKPMGLGFGGQIGAFRLWVDSDFTECQLAQIDTTYGVGKLHPGDSPHLHLKIARLEIWGFGGEDARSAQLLQQKRDQDIRDQARKVDRSLLIESQFDKEMFFSNTFAATADAREPTDVIEKRR